MLDIFTLTIKQHHGYTTDTVTDPQSSIFTTLAPMSHTPHHTILQHTTPHHDHHTTPHHTMITTPHHDHHTTPFYSTPHHDHHTTP
ncbi:histidine-rich glycoprotein-like [Penaeus indicus]|uniref:histidine-rich glycoprotein-like n=1 Tax=Penaeus indicus TaxID=29960 RepID=UPI00300D0A3F